MKTALFPLITLLAYACSSSREIQMNMVDVQLVKIDTVQRYANQDRKLLTWRSDDNVDYITFEPLHVSYPMGTHMRVMVRK